MEGQRKRECKQARPSAPILYLTLNFYITQNVIARSACPERSEAKGSDEAIWNYEFQLWKIVINLLIIRFSFPDRHAAVAARDDILLLIALVGMTNLQVGK